MFWLGESERLEELHVSKVLLSLADDPRSPHDVPSMIVKFLYPRTGLDIPQHASHIPRTRHDLTIVDESTTTQVTRMRAQLSRHLGDLPQRLSGVHATPTSLEGVDGTDVVQTTTRDELPRGGIGTGHDPGRTERDGVNLVGRIGVPDDELAVL